MLGARRSVVPADGDGSRPTLDTGTATRDLAAWTRDAGLGALHLSLASVPDARTRDWLRAIGRAGSVVTWSGDVPVLAISADPAAAEYYRRLGRMP